jgi:hypothetical protein
MGFLWLLPESFLLLIVVGLGIAVLVGALPFGRALLIILALVLAPVLIESLAGVAFDVLPWWMVALGLLIFAIQMLRFLGGLVIGDDAAAEMMGQLAAQTLLGCLRVLLLPFRALGWIVIRAIGG